MTAGQLPPAYQFDIPVGAQGGWQYLAIAAGVQAVVKASAGRLVRVSVTVAGAQGTINDAATVGAIAAGNLIGVIPAVVGVYWFDWPCLAGIIVTPGAAQVCTVSFI